MTAQQKPYKLEKTPKGWCGRFRCGEGPRRRVYIQAADEAQAYARADRVRDRIVALVAAGRAAAAAEMVDLFADARGEKEFAAVERAMRELAREATREAEVPSGPRTFDDVVEIWLSGELKRRWPQACRDKSADSVEHARGDYNKIIRPILGHLPVTEITEELAQNVVAAVSHKRLATRVKYECIVRQVMKFSVWPLKLITHSPLPPGYVESLEKRPREGQVIFPDEDSRFLSCFGIDLIERAVVGFQHRNGTRMGETEAFLWRHVNFVRGAITLVDSKTGTSRVWALAPDVLAALQRMREERDHDVDDGDRIFPDCRLESRKFRADLLRAGVDRHELHHAEGVMRPVNVHSTRAGFCTFALASGRTERWVMERTGHQSSDMLSTYVRAARTVEALQGARWYDPLDGLLWPTSPKGAPGGVPAVARMCAELERQVGHAVGQVTRIQPISAACNAQPRDLPGSSTPLPAWDSGDLAPRAHVDVHGGPPPNSPVGSPLGAASWGAADRERLLAALDAATAAAQWPIVDRLTRILDGEPLPPPEPRN